MVEGGSSFGFALKTGECLRIFGDVLGKKFQSDEAMEARIFGFVHHAHAAASQFFRDAVVGDGLADK